MRIDWMGALSLVLSTITLAIVLSISIRPSQQIWDSSPALAGLRSDAA